MHLTLGDESFEIIVRPGRLLLTIIVWLIVLWAVVMSTRPSRARP